MPAAIELRLSVKGGSRMAAKLQTRRAQVAVGVLVMAVGFTLAMFAATYLGKPADRLDPVVGLTSGLALIFLGATLVVPERQTRIRAWIGALMITSIAVMLDWIAFGPGDRQAGRGASSQLREVSRQILLESGAVLFNLMALWAWFRTRRTAWKKTAKA
jgi:hypothetical protein